MSCLFLEVIFLSLSLISGLFRDLSYLRRHSKHLSVDSASAIHKQAEESCLLAGPVGSGQGTQAFVLWLRTPELQALCLCTCYRKLVTARYGGASVPWAFSEILLCATHHTGSQRQIIIHIY